MKVLITPYTVPENIWAKTIADFVNPESEMFAYLEDMRLHIESTDEMCSYIHYRSAIRAYEVCRVTDQPHNMIKMRSQFEQNLNDVKKSLER